MNLMEVRDTDGTCFLTNLTVLELVMYIMAELTIG